MIDNNQKASGFNKLGINSAILKVLTERNFLVPTPIQQQCIPTAIEGKDIVGIAQTGTGKTLAFGIPIMQSILREPGQALILLPTRELALQVEEVLKALCHPLRLRGCVLIGGASMGHQIQMLRNKPQIIIATPGRLIDHISSKTFALNNVKMIVLDEADRMLDIGFMPQIKQILASAPTNRQTMMFSATMPKSISELAAKYMKLPVRIEVAPAGTPAKNIEQEVFIVPKDGKVPLLEKVLLDNPGTVLVFSRTKFGAKKIAAYLNKIGHLAVEIHSNRTLAQRKAAMEGFKSGKYRILVATDIAARGIDVANISLVLNYDLPDNAEDYVHRIGRTGRAGQSGKAISFAAPHEKGDIRQIERLISRTLPLTNSPLAPNANEPAVIIDTEAHRKFQRSSRGNFSANRNRPQRTSNHRRYS